MFLCLYVSEYNLGNHTNKKDEVLGSSKIINIKISLKTCVRFSISFLKQFLFVCNLCDVKNTIIIC